MDGDKNVGPIRVMWITLLILMLVWLIKYLDGFAVRPVEDENDSNKNNTNQLFNWHPLCIFLGYVVFMTEAILAYTTFPLSKLSRRWRKWIHAGLHSWTVLFLAGALAAVFQSHLLKKPNPIDNFYSPHSYLGLLSVVCFIIQVCGGYTAFGFPILNNEQRAGLVPFHLYYGLVAYVTGMITICVGIQEKTTFIKNNPPEGAGSYHPIFIIPAVMVLLIIMMTNLVVSHVVFEKRIPDVLTEQGPSIEAETPLVQETTTTDPSDP